ncbi:MAG TPA: hypothetical protein VG938_17390 [Verrucomicrobiae bacterium]|jgi:hypothetical protein|nr:hypothetical protein [Verrucomicrobiae bacterium]
MQIQFTPNTALIPVTLGDDASKFAVVIEQLAGGCLAQVEALAGGANPALFPQGNIGGEFIFRSSKTYANYHATFAQFQIEYGRLNQQGTLTLAEGAVTLTFANVILRAVQRIFDPQHSGARMGIRYTFAITTIT